MQCVHEASCSNVCVQRTAPTQVVPKKRLMMRWCKGNGCVVEDASIAFRAFVRSFCSHITLRAVYITGSCENSMALVGAGMADTCEQM